MRALAPGLVLLAAAAVAQPRFDFRQTPGRLSKDVLPRHVALQLDLDPAQDRFDGEATLTLELKRPQPALVLHAEQLEALEASIAAPDGTPQPLRIEPDAKTATWRLVPAGSSVPLAAGTQSLRLRWRGRVNATGQGLFRAGNPPMLATQLQAVEARRVFPAFDEPAFRTVYEIAVRAPQGLAVLSNMPAVSEVPAEGGRTLHRFAPSPAMASYLVAVAVGRFDVLEGRAGGLPLRILAAPGKREQARYALDITQQLMPWFADYFGQPYHLPKLDQLAVPGVREGAMEDWGLISYDEALLLYDPARSGAAGRRWTHSIIAHELSHQWFGNLVTAASWDEIWLNEAFATWIAEKATDHFNPDWQIALLRRLELEAVLQRDAGGATRAIRGGFVDEKRVFEVFDSITYDKGGAVLTMLEAWIGPEVFRRGMAAYIAERRMSSATAGDLWFHLGAVAGQDVGRVARRWTDRIGHPLVEMDARCEQGRTALTLRQQRFRVDDAPAAGGEPWIVPVVIARGAERRTLLLDRPEKRFVLDGCPVAAPLANAGGGGFFRVRHAPALQQRLLQQFQGLAAVDKLTLFSDALALVAAGRRPVADWVAMLALIPQVQDAARPMLFQHAIDGLTSMARTIPAGPVREAIDARARALLAPELERLGWQPRDTDDAPTLELRTALIRALAHFGDAAVVAEAGARVDAELGGGAAVAGAVRGGVFAVAGRGAGRSRFDALVARLVASGDQSERWVLLKALAGVGDPALARELLALSLDGRLSSDIALRVPGELARHSGHGALAYGFVVERWPEFQRLAGDSLFGVGAWLLPSAAQGFHRPDEAARLQADQARLMGEGGQQPAKEAAELIRQRAAWRAREELSLLAALRG
jgi:aminopeptidase N